MIKLVLLRHGQSTWNKENRFAGWTDIPLTDQGREEAKKAGKILRKKGFTFDIIFTSFLKRAIDTTNIVVKELGIKVPIKKTWRLNERHYGALQGLNKAKTTVKYGEEKVLQWRRSYNIRPPALTKEDERYPGKDPLYKDLDEKDLPLTESLKDTVARFVPFWKETIIPLLKEQNKILISASHNTLRAAAKYMENIPDEDITKLTIPLGSPLVYELDDNLEYIKHYYLESPADIKKALESYEAHVKNQK